MSNEETIIEGIKAGKTKGQVMADLIREDITLDLVKAGQLYAEVGAKEGLLLSAEQKESAVSKAVTDNTVEGKLNREAAVTALMTAASITKSSATNRLKAHCKEHGIEFPPAVRVGRDMEAVKDAYKKWWDAGTPRESIEAGLVKHYGYGEKSVGQAYVKIGRELGLIESGSAAGRVSLATWFANPANVEGDKAAIVARLMESTGVAKATADTRYGNWLFAVEYHKQLAA